MWCLPQTACTLDTLEYRRRLPIMLAALCRSCKKWSEKFFFPPSSFFSRSLMGGLTYTIRQLKPVTVLQHCKSALPTLFPSYGTFSTHTCPHLPARACDNETSMLFFDHHHLSSLLSHPSSILPLPSSLLPPLPPTHAHARALSLFPSPPHHTRLAASANLPGFSV